MKYLNKIFLKCAVIFMIVLVNSNCKNDTDVLNPVNAMNMTDQRWQKLANKKIYFGHQSVGYCIIDGIEKKRAKDSTDYKVFESKNQNDFILPGFYHSTIGENGSAKFKTDDFVALMDGGLAEKVDIAGFKLCYADIHVTTDIKEIFDYYVQKMDYLKKKYPDVTFVHFTVPVFAKPKGIKGLIKIMVYDHNKKRNRYNQLILNHYKNDLVFDIAKIESTYPDGKRNIYAKNRFALIDEYTSDGGHPNDQASEVIAGNYLIFLSDISSR